MAISEIGDTTLPLDTAPSERRALRCFALTLWLCFAATSTGTLPHDPNSRFELAERVLRDGRIDLPENTSHTVEHDGRRYLVFFPGQTILFLPLAAWSVWAPRVIGLGPTLAAFSGRFAATVFWMPLFSALTVVGFVKCLRLLGVPFRAALVGGALLAFATPLWIYATSGSEEAVLAAAAAWATWAALDARRILLDSRDDAPTAVGGAIADRIGLACVALAIGGIHRATFIAVGIAVGLIVLPALLRGRRALRGSTGRLALWIIAAVAVVMVVPAYNLLRFDNPLDTGYSAYYAPHGGVYAMPLLKGLRGHLISPGKSIFLYIPLLLLIPFALAFSDVRRRLAPLWTGLAVMTAIHLFIYARHTFWSGEWNWGVRFHVSLLPLLMLPVAVWIADAWQRQCWARGPVVMIATVSIVIQAAGLSLNHGLEHFQHPEDFAGLTNQVPEDAAWTWRGSQLRRRFVNIADKVSGEMLLESGDPRTDAATGAWNIFPTRAAARLDNPRMVIALWGLWGVLVLGAAGAGVRTIRLAKAAAPTPRGAAGDSPGPMP